VDTSVYRSLLTDLVVQLRAIRDIKGAQLVGRWVLTLEADNHTAQSRQKLHEHFEQVKRSVQAISIIAVEKYSPTKASTTLLEDTIKSLLSELNRLLAALNHIREVVNDPGIVSLSGEFLSSVTFVMDYVQLSFCDQTITCFIHPTVEESGGRYRITTPGYRDVLCRRIGIEVTSAVLRETNAITLEFADRSRIIIHLTDNDFTGPEFANYRSSSGRLWVY
jgi:hypothetical protein